MELNTDMSDVDFREIEIEDPIAEDEESDAQIVTTRRAITRVALIAAETASRFDRERVAHDPMAWMLAPRRLFFGEAAIDACLRLDDFQRALLLHGLSLGLDADPEDIDELSSDGEEEMTFAIDPESLFCVTTFDVREGRFGPAPIMSPAALELSLGPSTDGDDSDECFAWSGRAGQQQRFAAGSFFLHACKLGCGEAVRAGLVG